MWPSGTRGHQGYACERITRLAFKYIIQPRGLLWKACIYITQDVRYHSTYIIMSTSRTTTIKFHKTVSSSLTGPTTIATFASTNIQPSVTVAAVLTEPSTTVTAYEIPGTTSLAVIDGTTLEWRHQGITLANGDVISIGFNGLEDKTTTASYGTLSVGSGTVSASESVSVSILYKPTHTQRYEPLNMRRFRQAQVSPSLQAMVLYP